MRANGQLGGLNFRHNVRRPSRHCDASWWIFSDELVLVLSPGCRLIDLPLELCDKSVITVPAEG
jgi:hypothetical protein